VTSVSVIVPVRNGGEDLRRCLEGIRAQRTEHEVETVVVDSASDDGSPALARELGARVHEIALAEFNHGATRNLAAELAGGDTLVFTSQDAVPDDPGWLERLVLPLTDDPGIAGVYGRQLPHYDASAPERFFLDFLYGPWERTQRVNGRSELDLRTTLFSNVNAAIRRDVWERFRFADDIIMSEDQEWAVRVLLAGYSLRYEPGASVRHSHPYTIGSAFRRFFDSGVSAERAYLAGERPSARALRAEAMRYAREELAWLAREGEARSIPYAAAYELAKYAGVQLGARHRLLPRFVKRRLSALPSYWDRPSPPAERPAAEVIDSPAPIRCVACDAPMSPWRIAEPQDPRLGRRWALVRCERCGTASTAGEAEPELYETGVYAAETTRLSPLVEAVRRTYERQKLGLLGRAVAPPARVLEAGAGQGRFVRMARAAGYEASGFEPSAKGVEVAATRGVELQRASLESASVEAASVDAVVLWHVLEHLDEPGPALDRVRSWLRPGGALLLGVPNVASLQAAIAGPRWLHLDVPRHRHHFTPAGIRSLLAAHGFGVAETEHLLFEHNPFGMWQAWLDRATTSPSYAYNLIKRNARPTARDLVPTVAIAALAPLALAIEGLAGLAGRGGTIAVVARRASEP
jgi:GT2 family glycosyltransferase/SAM-dependent methyltransferase